MIGKVFWGGGVPALGDFADNQEAGHFRMPRAEGLVRLASTVGRLVKA